MELPPLFLSRMQALLGEEYPAFLASLGAPSVSGLRVNTLKLSSQEFQRLSPYALQPVPWSDTGFILPTTAAFDRFAPGKHPFHAAGLYYLQDPSAMAAAEVLAPQPGERVLDLAAAPGGKASHLAAQLQGQGFLVANEIHPRRVWDLAENLERLGITNAVVTNETPERLADHFGAYFDRVLLDAPCSGEGLFRKAPEARRTWNTALVQSCAVRQDALLAQAARLVRPGGWLVYSTCTFAPEENEAVIARFLQKKNTGSSGDTFDCAAIHHRPGYDSACPTWISSAERYLMNTDLEQAIRLWPHRSPGEGHFIALLHRSALAPSEDFARPHSHSQRNQTAFAQARRVYLDFVKQNLSSDQAESPQSTLTLRGTYLYSSPPGLPELSGLKVIHPGLWLGVIKKDRFEPAHALAHALPVTGTQRLITLHSDSTAIQAYLRGETIPANAHLLTGDGKGWVLVTLPDLDGKPRFPLGWGKYQAGQSVKNFYPKGLRQF